MQRLRHHTVIGSADKACSLVNIELRCLLHHVVFDKLRRRYCTIELSQTSTGIADSTPATVTLLRASRVIAHSLRGLGLVSWLDRSFILTILNILNLDRVVLRRGGVSLSPHASRLDFLDRVEFGLSNPLALHASLIL